MSGRVWWPALALLLALAPRPAAALPDKTWVVAIGNNRGEADEVALRFAERDAEQVVDTFEQVGGLAPSRVVRLMGRDADAVRRALDDIDTRLAAEPDGSLVVFYSGHADAHALHLGGTLLPIEELTDRVERANGRLRLLIIDACRSGSASRVKGLTPTADIAVQVEQRGQAEGLAIITSSTAGEDSQESDALRASFFSHHLTNGLRGAADKNGDARVTLAEAYAYTYAQTLRSSGRTLKLQHPTYRFDLKGRGAVVLSRIDARADMGQLELGPPAVYVVSEGAEGGPVAAEVAPARAAARLVLPPRTYHVQERHPRSYRQYRVRVEPGRTTRIADQTPETLRYDQLVRARGGPARSVHGLMALGGARSGLLAGEGLTPQAVVGYQADLPWFSVGARARFGTVAAPADDPAADRRHDEYALALTIERFVDFGPLSAAFGLLVEGAWHHQTFVGARPIDARSTFGAGFGGLVALERHLPQSWAPGLALRLEGGPYSALLEVTEVDAGVPVGTRWATPLTGWAALGVRWRL